MKKQIKKRGYKRIEPFISSIRAMRLNGSSEAEIREFFGISKATCNRYKEKYPEFKEAVETDRKKADFMVEEALLKSATGYTKKVKKFFKLKDVSYDERGKKVETERLEEREEEQFIPPNISAQTFWLKVRCGAEWDESKKESEQGFESGVVILPEVVAKGEDAYD